MEYPCGDCGTMFVGPLCPICGSILEIQPELAAIEIDLSTHEVPIEIIEAEIE